MKQELTARLTLSEAMESFAPGEDVRHAIFLTYGFDGPFLEDPDNGFLDVLWRRNCQNTLVVRDGAAVIKEKQSHRYAAVNASYSVGIFHSKLALLISPSEALAIIGSANLSRGGLRGNLELANVYRLTRSAGPKAFFAALHDYLRQQLVRELQGVSSRGRESLESAVSDLRLLLMDSQRRAQRDDGSLSFLHNYERPLFEQVVGLLRSKHLERMWIISPFYEVEKEDPAEDGVDDSLWGRLLRSFDFGSEAIHVFFQTDSEGRTRLPVGLLTPYQDKIELHQRDMVAFDQRSLHAKMLAFQTREAGRRFLTIVHGSANFTAAAMLSRPPGGNAEIAVVTRLRCEDLTGDRLADYLDLSELFSVVPDWSKLSSLKPQRRPVPAVQVWEALLSLLEGTISIHLRVGSPAATEIAVYLVGAGPNIMLGRSPVSTKASTHYEYRAPADVVTHAGQGAGLRQVPYHSVLVEAYDGAGKLLGIGKAALNVTNPEAFYGDWLCGPEDNRLDDQIYQAGLGAGGSDYERMRLHVERLLSGSAVNDSPPSPTHQGDLDLFFRRIHVGFRGLHLQLRERRGSLLALSDLLRLLAKWGKAATRPDGALSPEQQLYLLDRIVREVADALAYTRKSIRRRDLPGKLMREAFLSKAGEVLEFGRDLQRDEALGVVARSLVARWNSLGRAAVGGRRHE